MKNQVGYLGIDVGTQGLSIVFCDEEMKVVATGDGHYEMLPGLADGCYEQSPDDWAAALRAAMDDLRNKMSKQDRTPEVLAIGISGQMHGEVLADADGNVLKPVRLWCDARNEAEGDELTDLFGVKMPKRITTARWLWTIRNLPEIAKQVAHMTTPGGWLAFHLTGQWNLGIGDSAGMFPIDQESKGFKKELLNRFDRLASNESGSIPSLGAILPAPRLAGDAAGQLNARGAELMGLPPGIPVAPAEGDQPAALAGSLIGSAGQVSMSFGTSVCANSVGDKAFSGVSQAVDHFCAADGKPINMVWLRNGTTYMNTIVEMFETIDDAPTGTVFEKAMPKLLQASNDCGGVMALPFADDEPGLGVSQGGTALLVGLNSSNANVGNVAKAALLSTMFNLKKGSQVLADQGFPLSEIILTGGLTRTPELGQILANVFNTPVSILESASEGSAWGAALTAKYRYQCLNRNQQSWEDFLAEHKTGNATTFAPIAAEVAELVLQFDKYSRLLNCRQGLEDALGNS
ncbi:MAG: FGGY family carbohydrate kinase [Pirellulaceae bacterium]